MVWFYSLFSTFGLARALPPFLDGILGKSFSLSPWMSFNTLNTEFIKFSFEFLSDLSTPNGKELNRTVTMRIETY
jgi:hypothetical protein